MGGSTKMTNQLEEQLKSVQNTIEQTKKECRQGKYSDNICVKKIALLRAEEHRILKELNI